MTSLLLLIDPRLNLDLLVLLGCNPSIDWSEYVLSYPTAYSCADYSHFIDPPGLSYWLGKTKSEVPHLVPFIPLVVKSKLALPAVGAPVVPDRGFFAL